MQVEIFNLTCETSKVNSRMAKTTEFHSSTSRTPLVDY